MTASGATSRSARPATISAAEEITGLQDAVTGSNTGASKETGEPEHAGDPGGRSVWWKWVAPDDGTATIDTIGSSFDTLLAVYTGNNVAGLTLVSADDDSGGNYASALSFRSTFGTTYWIAVDGYDGAMGTISLNLTPSEFQQWQLAYFSSTRVDESLSHADPDHDGITNLLEFAFGLHPWHNSAGLMPRPQMSAGNLELSFAEPPGVTGITYGAEWSPTMAPGTWQALTDIGSTPQHTFSTPIDGNTKKFVRLKVTIP